MNVVVPLMWIAATLYAAATIAFVLAVSFSKERLYTAGVWLAVAGVVPQIIATGIRWSLVHQAPSLGFYDTSARMALFSVVAFLLLVWRYPKTAPIGVAVMPVALLILAAAMLSPKGGIETSAKLASWWLAIHVLFANAAFASFLGAFGLSIAFLMQERGSIGRLGKFAQKLPAPEVVDYLASRFVVAGFIFWGIMISSGAVWANEAWGRYWGWDPIETWSLVVWMVYAIYLHLRLTMGWRGRRLAWLAIVTMPFAMFCVIGVPFVFKSIHAAYISG